METISICISSHNTLSRGTEVLERAINSIAGSITTLYNTKDNYKGNYKVIISWVDDASTDDTLQEVKRLRDIQSPIIRDNFFINSIEVNKGQAYCRNLAASLYNSDYICLFDSDDEMYNNHLIICALMMEVISKDNKKYAMGTTRLQTNQEFHPEWVRIMSDTNPITKIIRRDAWEFLEGMPTDYLYRKMGGEDSAFINIFSAFFRAYITNNITVKYWEYPGSSLSGQAEKFKKDPADSDKFSKFPQEKIELREALTTQKIEYLKRKAEIFNLFHDFDHLVRRPDWYNMSDFIDIL